MAVWHVLDLLYSQVAPKEGTLHMTGNISANQHLLYHSSHGVQIEKKIERRVTSLLMYMGSSQKSVYLAQQQTLNAVNMPVLLCW